jgi:hypothetical protein
LEDDIYTGYLPVCQGSDEILLFASVWTILFGDPGFEELSNAILCTIRDPNWPPSKARKFSNLRKTEKVVFLAFYFEVLLTWK